MSYPFQSQSEALARVSPLRGCPSVLGEAARLDRGAALSAGTSVPFSAQRAGGCALSPDRSLPGGRCSGGRAGSRGTRLGRRRCERLHAVQRDLNDALQAFERCAAWFAIDWVCSPRELVRAPAGRRWMAPESRYGTFELYTPHHGSAGLARDAAAHAARRQQRISSTSPGGRARSSTVAGRLRAGSTRRAGRGASAA